jgi:hypothetical protein
MSGGSPKRWLIGGFRPIGSPFGCPTAVVPVAIPIYHPARIMATVRRVSVHGQARRVARAYVKVNKSDRVARLATLHLFPEHLVFISRQTQPVSGVRPLAGASARVAVSGPNLVIVVRWLDGQQLSVSICSAVKRARRFAALLNCAAAVLPVT